jgi:hypothetical protein
MSTPDAFSAGLAVARADAMLRNRGNTGLAVSGSASDPFAEAEEVNASPLTMLDDKETSWALRRFWQQADKTLHLAPLPFYPGIILASSPDVPAANSKLWVRLEYLLQAADYGFDDLGWSGAIIGTSAELRWSADNLTADNVIFPGDKSSSLPANQTLVLHFQIGRTDGDKNFTLEILHLDTSTPLLTPPL